MEDWMRYEQMLPEVFQQPGAYPFPFGSASLGWVQEASEADLRRLSLPRLRDQAVSVDLTFMFFKGAYMALHHVTLHQGLTPYLDEELTRVCGSLRSIQVQQRRLRALLDAAPQPRAVGRN